MHKQLSKTEREELYILRQKGYSWRDIGKALGRSHSTLSREWNRNKVKGKYVPQKAQVKKYQRRYWCKKDSKKIIKYPELRDYVEIKMKEEWSPEQIVGRWNKDHEVPTLSVPTLYNYLYSGYGIGLCKYLCTKRQKKKKLRPKTKRSIIPNRVWIDDRPDSVDSRSEVGDWEADYIVSQKGDSTAFLTLLERKSRYLEACKLSGRRARTTQKMVNQVLSGKPAKSLTLDNDIGFSRHENMNVSTFFCHPYSSWEKGAVEYANRLLRRYFPKKTCLKKVSYKQLKSAVRKINNTPRKCLGFMTPTEVFLANSTDPP